MNKERCILSLRPENQPPPIFERRSRLVGQFCTMLGRVAGVTLVTLNDFYSGPFTTDTISTEPSDGALSELVVAPEIPLFPIVPLAASVQPASLAKDASDWNAWFCLQANPDEVPPAELNR